MRRAAHILADKLEVYETRFVEFVSGQAAPWQLENPQTFKNVKFEKPNFFNTCKDTSVYFLLLLIYFQVFQLVVMNRVTDEWPLW